MKNKITPPSTRIRKFFAGMLVPVALVILNGDVLAAPIPEAAMQKYPDPAGIRLKHSGDTLEYYRLEDKVESKSPSPSETVTDKTPSPVKSPAADTVRVFISRIAVDASEILTAEEVQAITAPYENREISMSELYEVVGKINEVYKNKNYITAKAILPPQTITDGVVRIQLVEGRLGQLLLSGNQNTRDAFFLDRLNLVNGDLVRLDNLEQQLTRFNLLNDVRLRAELKPGATFGTTDIVLIAQEPENQKSLFFADNAGSKNTGQYRFGLSWNNQSLTGNRDTLTLVPVWTKGSFSGSAAYSIPVNSRGGRLAVSYDKNRIDILKGDFAELNIEGYSYDLGVSYTWPRSVRPGFKSEQSLQVHAKNSETFFDGTKYIETDVRTAVMSFSIQTSSRNNASYVYHAVTRADSDNVKGSSQFIKYNLSAVNQKALETGCLLTLRLEAQLTPDRNLPTVEQFSLGGMSSVRGYPTGLLLGDRGYFISAEWSRSLSEKVTGLLFIDHGGAIPYKGNNQTNTSDDYLTSCGVGVTLKFDDHNSAKVVLGIPLQHAADYSPRVHFVWQSLL